MAKAAMQEKAEMSMFMLCKLEENSTIASTHSPNPRTHCSLCNTTPLQNISLPSTGLDLQLIRRGGGKALITLGSKWGFKRLLIIGRLIKLKAMKLEGGADNYPKPQIVLFNNCAALPVRQPQDEQLQEGGFKEEILILLR